MSLKYAMEKYKKALEKIKKERKGNHNMTFNEKLSTPIQTDLEAIENAVIDYKE